MTTYVCFDLDRECGDMERSWCATCPKRKLQQPVAATLPAPPASTEQAERQLFEVAYAQLHRCTPGGGWSDRSSVSGDYEEVDTQDAWILWNAALALLGKRQIAELRDTLIQLTTTQKQLIDANAEIAALLMGVHPDARQVRGSRDAGEDK